MALALAICSCNGAQTEAYVFQDLSATPDKPTVGQRVNLHASVWDPNGYTNVAPSYEFEASGGELFAKSSSAATAPGNCVTCKSCDIIWVAPSTPGTYTIKVKYADVSKELTVRVYPKPSKIEKVGPPGL